MQTLLLLINLVELLVIAQLQLLLHQPLLQLSPLLLLLRNQLLEIIKINFTSLISTMLRCSGATTGKLIDMNTEVMVKKTIVDLLRPITGSVLNNANFCGSAEELELVKEVDGAVVSMAATKLH